MKRTKHQGILIEGNEIFLERTIEALKILEKKTIRFYKMLRKNTKTIELSNRSSAFVKEKKIAIIPKDAFHMGIEWYAGVLIHEAYHIYLHHTLGYIAHASNEKSHEATCHKIQIEFLKKVNRKDLARNVKIRFKNRFNEELK